MDRRKFFQQSKTELGSQLTDWLGSSRLANFGKLFGQFAPRDGGAFRYRRLIREAEPMNQEGHGFGGRLRTLTGIIAPDALPGRRVLVVAGHGEATRGRAGASVIELEKTEEGWRHNVSSPLNKRWADQTPTPIEGALLDTGNPEKPAYWEREMTAGVGAIICATALPWQSIVLAESATGTNHNHQFGWLIEINAASGSAVKRFAMGRVNAAAIEPVTYPGRSTVVYVLGREGILFKFVSLQKFDSHRHDANLTAFAIGSLFAANFDGGVWLPLSIDMPSEQWMKNMRDPAVAAASNGCEPLAAPIGLSWNRRTGELSIRHAGAVSVLKESGDHVDE